MIDAQTVPQECEGYLSAILVRSSDAIIDSSHP